MQNLKPQDIYEAIVTKTAPDGTDLTLEGTPIPAGRVVRIHTFYVIDITTSNKTLRLGYDHAGSKKWAKRKAAGTGAYGIWQSQTMILVENEKPAAMIESPTASDECTMIARGVYL